MGAPLIWSAPLNLTIIMENKQRVLYRLSYRGITDGCRNRHGWTSPPCRKKHNKLN